MFYTAGQLKEIPAGAQKIELAGIIKHHQMRQQVAETFLCACSECLQPSPGHIRRGFRWQDTKGAQLCTRSTTSVILQAPQEIKGDVF